MRLILVFALFAIQGCQTTSDTQGTGTATPPVDNFDKVGQQIDKSDQRVAAAVTVARENADKPAVVKAETAVALAYLPAPSADSLAYARNRAARANPDDYRRAEEAGRKLLAVIDANWAKSEADAAKNKAALESANKQITALKAEVAQAKKDVVTWTCAGIGACLALAAVALAWLRQFLGAVACAAGSACLLSFPSLVETPWFLPSLASLGGVCVLGGLWYAFKSKKPATAPLDTHPDAQEPNNQGGV
jgi:hypothetical protein